MTRRRRRRDASGLNGAFRPASRLFAVGLVALLMLFPQTCQQILDGLTLPQKNLAASSNPGEQAAAFAASEAEKEKKAQDAAKQAIANSDPKAMDAAVDARPNDPTYLFQRGLLNWGKDQDKGSDLADALGMVKDQARAQSKDEKEQTFKSQQAESDAFLVVLQGTKRTAPEWTRINDFYCASVDFLAAVAKDSTDPNSVITVGSFPRETCRR